MIPRLKHLLYGAGLALAVILGSSGSAQAGFRVQFYIDLDTVHRYTVDDATDPTPGNDAISVDGYLKFVGGNLTLVNAANKSGSIFQVSLFGSTSNTPGALGEADLFSAETNYVNVTNAVHTLHVLIGANNYTNPAGPEGIVLTSSAGGSYTGKANNANTYKFQSYVDTSNTLLGLGAITTGSQTAVVNGVGSSLSYATGNATLNIGTLTPSPYAVTAKLDIKLSGNNSLGGSTNTALVASVPEPTTIAAFAAGLPLLGFGAWRRRKAQA